MGHSVLVALMHSGRDPAKECWQLETFLTWINTKYILFSLDRPVCCVQHTHTDERRVWTLNISLNEPKDQIASIQAGENTLITVYLLRKFVLYMYVYTCMVHIYIK